MIISMLGKEQSFAAPVVVRDIIAAMAPEYLNTALGCFRGGKALELGEIVAESCALHPITYQNEEGRRIYERSLRFVLLPGLGERLPELRVLHPVDHIVQRIHAHFRARVAFPQQPHGILFDHKKHLPVSFFLRISGIGRFYAEEGTGRDAVRLEYKECFT